MRLTRRTVVPVPSRSAYAGFRFPPEVIVLAVRWYLRFGLSYRDVEELLAERGIDVDHVTVHRWVRRFGPLLADAARFARQVTDRAPTYPRVLEEMWPAAWHHVERYANNRVEADHAQLKRRLNPMRGIKTMTGLRIVAAGHASCRTCAAGTMRSPPMSRPARDSPSRSANWPPQSECDAAETPAPRAPRSANATVSLDERLWDRWGRVPWPRSDS
jgi:transposase-like protein